MGKTLWRGRVWRRVERTGLAGGAGEGSFGAKNLLVEVTKEFREEGIDYLRSERKL